MVSGMGGVPVARTRDRCELWLAAVIVSLAAAFFVADVLLPLGVAGGVPYVAVVLLTLWAPRRRYTFLVVAAVVVLVLAAPFFKPAGSPWFIVFANRFLALFAVGATAFLVLQRQHFERRLRAAHGELERRVDERTADLIGANTVLEQQIVERKRVEEKIERDYDEQRVVRAILEASTRPLPVEEFLTQTLDALMTVPWLRLQTKGAIFLVEEDVLMLRAQRNLDPAIVAACSVVPLGRCLCGRAAATGETVFADCVDARHEISFPGMPEHGHLCVPIRVGARPLGVLNLYVEHGHRWDPREARFLGLIADTLAGVIERKRMDERLTIALAERDNIMASVPDILYTLDVAGNIVRWNRRVEIVTGYTAADIDGRPALSFFAEEDRPAVARAIQEAVATGHADVDGRLVTADGALVPYRWSGALMRDESGRILGITGMGRDISAEYAAEQALRASEEALRQSNQVLDRRVRERTAEIEAMNKALFLEVAERRRVEAKIRASQAELDAILNHMQDTFYRTDAAGRILRASASVEQLLGYRIDEIVGRKLSDLYVDPAERGRFLEEMKHSGGTVTNHESHLRRKDGSTIWVLTNAQYYRDTDGNILGVEGTTRDVTTRREAERTMRELEERFSKAFHGNPVPITISAVDDGRFIDVNDAFLEMSGYCRGEVIARTSVELGLWVDEGDRERLLGVLRRDGVVRGMGIRFRTKSSDLRHALLSVETVDIAGAPCLLAVTQDITQRVRAEAALREALAELQSQKFALDQHSIVAITDRHGRITYANDRFCEISQYTRAELLGQDHRLLNSGYHPRAFFQEMYATIGRGQVWHGEVRNRKKDGDIYWVDTTIVPFKDDSGRPYQYVAIRTDITARRLYEEELQQARDQALAAVEAKSRFLATMSHEIRTPMNGALGMTELLLDTPLDAEQREYAETIHGSGKALLGILNDILDFSKIEAGRLELEQIDFDLAQTIDSVVRLMSGQARLRNLYLRAEPLPALAGGVRGDPFRLRQVLLNLISNALKFTEQGGITLRVLAETDGGRSPRLRFEVEDTGVGVPAQAHTSIFEPFSQADGSITRRHGGTGLGLAIAREIVDRMGGEIGVTSEPGRGSVFWFTVGLKSSTAAPVDAPRSRVVGADSSRRP